VDAALQAPPPTRATSTTKILHRSHGPARLRDRIIVASTQNAVAAYAIRALGACNMRDVASQSSPTRSGTASARRA